MNNFGRKHKDEPPTPFIFLRLEAADEHLSFLLVFRYMVKKSNTLA